MEIKSKACNPANHGGTLKNVQYIVVHWTSNQSDTAKNNADYFARENVGASAHYFVDENEVWASVPENCIAWHCGAKKYYHPYCRNSNSIGVEMCLTGKGYVIRRGTIENAVRFVRALMQAYEIPIENVVRHYDVTHKYCMPLDSTELLTKDGWKSLDDVSTSDFVAAYIPDTDSIDFQKVLDKVVPYTDVVLKSRGIEATANHRMYTKPNCKNSHKFRETLWGDILEGGKQHIVKNGSVYHGAGLDLSDDEIRFLVWVQGDGHYMKNDDRVYGIEFHLQKNRKILRIKSILEDLDIRYTVCNKSDGSTSIRIYGKEHVSFAENWLNNKQFTYAWLEMSVHQFDIFWDEILVVDGHLSERFELYTSSIEKNLDVVQAICSTKGVRTNKTTIGDSGGYGHPIALIRSRSNYSIGGCRKTVEERECEVSCVTVPSGYILIRQNGKTFIVGNCPGPMVNDITLWNAFKSALAAEQEDEMKVYQYVKDMPEWAQASVTKAIKKGVVAMDTEGAVSIYECNLQPLVWMDRVGLLD